MVNKSMHTKLFKELVEEMKNNSIADTETIRYIVNLEALDESLDKYTINVFKDMVEVETMMKEPFLDKKIKVVEEIRGGLEETIKRAIEKYKEKVREELEKRISIKSMVRFMANEINRRTEERTRLLFKAFDDFKKQLLSSMNIMLVFLVALTITYLGIDAMLQDTVGTLILKLSIMVSMFTIVLSYTILLLILQTVKKHIRDAEKYYDLTQVYYRVKIDRQ